MECQNDKLDLWIVLNPEEVLLFCETGMSTI
jgi:hypothetical protein